MAEDFAEMSKTEFYEQVKIVKTQRRTVNVYLGGAAYSALKWEGVSFHWLQSDILLLRGEKKIEAFYRYILHLLGKTSNCF